MGAPCPRCIFRYDYITAGELQAAVRLCVIAVMGSLERETSDWWELQATLGVSAVSALNRTTVLWDSTFARGFCQPYVPLKLKKTSFKDISGVLHSTLLGHTQLGMWAP